ncbi:MAG: hypothetical protein LBC99_09525 [Spirochaetota bacterium]|jgi:hypothetical protein|nr:hypothetical protein [Spirochaetota bacterium]
MKRSSFIIAGILALFGCIACGNDPDVPNPGIQLTRFAFERAYNPGIPAAAEGVIDHSARLVFVQLNADDVTSLRPTIRASGMSRYEPEGEQDFTDPVFYILYSADGFSTIGYEVAAVPAGDGYDVALAKQYLEIGYAPGESAGSVRTSVQLANSWTNGCAITWTASSPNLSIAGTVGAVTPAADDLSVVLTAVITKGGASATKLFSITIAGSETGLSDAARAREDRDALAIGYAAGDSANAVTKNLTLPAVGSRHGSAITWVSDTPGVIAASGAVTQPAAGDRTVVLTATIQRGAASETKVFTVVVKAIPAALPLVFANSDFEANASLTAVVGAFSYSSAEFYTGARSLHVTGTLGSSNNGILIETSGNCNSKGTRSKVVFWIKGRGTNKSIAIRMRGDLYWNLKSATTVSSTGSGDYSGNFNRADWVKVTLALASAENPSGYKFEIRGGSSGTYDFYIDDIIFE